MQKTKPNMFDSSASQRLLNKIFLQPWYLSRATAVRINECLPAEHRHKMRYYFEDYGCLRCKKKNVAYGSNAMCRICVGQTKLRLVWAIKRRWTATNTLRESRPSGLNRMSEAQRLLADIAGRQGRKSRARKSFIDRG
jgi:hypothetical protein